MKIVARLKFYYALAAIFIGMTLMILIFPFVRKPWAQKISSWFIRLFIFTPVHVKGSEDEGVQMFVLNHQSDIDIGIMETITRKDLAWVAKKELFDVPFYGLLLKLPNDIPVERESKTSLIKLLKDAKDRLDDGRVITIFPEGTRAPGGRMLPFKAGPKLLAEKYALRVQPVVLIHTSEHFNIKTKHYAPGTVTAVYLEAFSVDKADEGWYERLHTQMQKIYDDELSNHPRHR
ncbi:MAG: 1-acyl-sn-glycerol-3-phosphate acyltransferase [Campylobacterales bacterium]|nr:1-acyl-sn-glycerol-3-phosphate acyltransferase [Campylobacterales bacterium]